MYCEKLDHRSSDLKTAKTVTNRIKKLSDKNVCFNCAGAKNRSAECSSTKNCLKYKNKHHSFECDKLADSKTEPMLVTTETNVTNPVVITK